MASGDPGVAVGYNIKMTGFGDIPAMGSATAYIDAHIQEARTDDGKAEDVTYSETSTAAGDITLFQKAIDYQSGLRRLLRSGDTTVPGATRTLFFFTVLF